MFRANPVCERSTHRRRNPRQIGFLLRFFNLFISLKASFSHVMHSLTQEIKSFSRTNLRKQCTRVTTLSGKRIIETWKDARMQVVEVADCHDGDACGYVQDLSLDLQVGVIKPWLLLGM